MSYFHVVKDPISSAWGVNLYYDELSNLFQAHLDVEFYEDMSELVIRNTADQHFHITMMLQKMFELRSI